MRTGWLVVPPGSVTPDLSRAIDLIEVVYDFEKLDSEWLDAMIAVGTPIFDHGLGFAVDEYLVTRKDGLAEVSLRVVRTVSLPSDYTKRTDEALAVLPPEMLANINPPGYAGTWTEISRNYPAESKLVLEKVGYADLLGILARDPNGVGMRITAPMSEVTKLLPKSREQWQMIGAHIASAYRLRRALASRAVSPPASGHRLPRDAEAVVDPRRFHIVDAVEGGREESAADCLRRAAKRIDHARSGRRREDPVEALAAWKALVCGRWSLIDWFDSDERRFMLAMPNPPEVRDPRGLTEQECQVVEYAVLGDTNKIIAYRLGLSQTRVSSLLRSAMKKLGVRTRGQLGKRIPPLPFAVGAPRKSAVG
jgi:DNA-binding CsgD family transcriptional regulator